jgi:FkbM family methyltransferase
VERLSPLEQVSVSIKRLIFAPRNLLRAAAAMAPVEHSRLETLLFRLALSFDRMRTTAFRFRWRGLSFRARPVDVNAINEVLLDDEYGGLRPLLAAAPAAPVIVDAGANIGLFAIFVLALRPDAIVHSLEPAPATFRVLARNVLGNSRFKWHAHRLALWRDAGMIPFESQSASTGSYVVQDHDVTSAQTETVPAQTLAGWLKEHDLARVYLLKLDIEGAEQAVLEAAPSVLDRISHLIVEIHPGHVDEEAIMRLIESKFPFVQALPRRKSNKPLILASRQPSDTSKV